MSSRATSRSLDSDPGLDRRPMAGSPERHHGWDLPAGTTPEGERRLLVNEVSRLTGVSRERLRTWERRHGFPTPQRYRSGLRSYAKSDLLLIVSVSRLIESGYPVGDAIVATLAGAQSTRFEADAPLLEHAPMPAVAFEETSSGELQVVWANSATRLQPGTLGGLDSKPHEIASAGRLGAGAVAEFHTVLGGPAGGAPRLIDHTDWVGTFPVICNSLCWRSETGAGPVVVVVQVPRGSIDGSGKSTADHEAARWAAATAAARGVLQRENGLVSAQHALRELTEQARAFDGLLALRHASGLRTASSVRGMVPACTIDFAHCPRLWATVGPHGDVGWLGPEASEAFGLPSYLRFLAIPLAISGQPIGAAVLCFQQERALSGLVDELLHGFGASVAASIRRDRTPRTP